MLPITTVGLLVMHSYSKGHFCVMLDALAFLPEDDLPQAIAYLQTRVPEVDRLAELLMYFNSTYISDRTTGRCNEDNDGRLILHLRRSPLLYPPSVWNLHAATLTASQAWKRRTETSVRVEQFVPCTGWASAPSTMDPVGCFATG